jgi:hypothetical protein
MVAKLLPLGLESPAAMASVVRCGNCKTLLAEPSDTPPEQRVPCPTCGSTARQFEKNLTATVTAGAMVLGADAPQVRIEKHRLEDAGFDVQWLRLSKGGAWMVQVYDREGNWIDGSVQDDPQDALLGASGFSRPHKTRFSEKDRSRLVPIGTACRECA